MQWIKGKVQNVKYRVDGYRYSSKINKDEILVLNGKNFNNL